MKTNRHFTLLVISAVLVSGALVAGCSSSDTTTPTAGAVASNTVPGRKPAAGGMMRPGPKPAPPGANTSDFSGGKKM